MNPHYPGAPSAPPNMHGQHYSRRQHEYHQYQYGLPLSPGSHNPYAYPHGSHYYGQPMPAPYQMPRWAPQPSFAPYGIPPPMHNPQASPMAANSHPHGSSTHRPLTYPQSATTQQPLYSNAQANSSASVISSHAISSPDETHPSADEPLPLSRRPSVTPQTAPTHRMPYYPQLPWYSTADARDNFPPPAVRTRHRFHFQAVGAGGKVLLPSRNTSSEKEPHIEREQNVDSDLTPPALEAAAPAALDPGPLESQSHTQQPEASTAKDTGLSRRLDAKHHVPVIPALPQIPSSRSKTLPPPERPTHPLNGQPGSDSSASHATEPFVEGSTATVTPKVVPKSWADLVRTKALNVAANDNVNGGSILAQSAKLRGDSIGEVVRHFDVDGSRRIPFLEPRGLVNTGNMCYMNSILQVLLFCVPFYDFLDQVGKRAVHSFKSDTLLLDTMIMFMREYKVIDGAETVEKLRMRLKDADLEQYGDPLIPEYVYSVINQLPRFSSMRRGHQQDAEEFLGFLLAGLHDECIALARPQGASSADSLPPTSPTSAGGNQETSDWLEVGPKQRAAVTRQSGDPSASSPVSRIFGGTLRSELRVPGLKNSVTLEQYQPLQLDIGSPEINNITSALKGLTKSESLTGDFGSPRGPGTTATKQVFIETLPPVLILHLKRFQYDSSGGTQKIWKRIGYPLDLEMPKEVFPPAKRSSFALNGGLPRYRLTAVVYHHGKSAAGGHYTVDLLRQDKREWVRIDDTFIRRVRADDVAEAGSEEDPKLLAKALEKHQHEQHSASRNPFDELEDDNESADNGKAWSDVNGNEHKKRWAGVAAAGAGTATPSTPGRRTPKRDSVRDNKVAYILLYEKV